MISIIIIFLGIMISLVLIKPEFLYSKKLNRFKQFGADEDQTLLSLPLVSVFMAIIVSFIINVIDN